MKKTISAAWSMLLLAITFTTLAWRPYYGHRRPYYYHRGRDAAIATGVGLFGGLVGAGIAANEAKKDRELMQQQIDLENRRLERERRQEERKMRLAQKPQKQEDKSSWWSFWSSDEEQPVQEWNNDYYTGPESEEYDIYDIGTFEEE